MSELGLIRFNLVANSEDMVECNDYGDDAWGEEEDANDDWEAAGGDTNNWNEMMDDMEAELKSDWLKPFRLVER